MKKTASILITILIMMAIWFFSYGKTPHKPIESPVQNPQAPVSTTTVSAFEKQLINTAWIQLDEQGNETDEEYDFRDTKDNDPAHTHYDFAEYLHQRPGESGYWKIERDKLTLIGSPSDIPPYSYTIIEITSDTLILSDDGTNITFKAIKTSN